MISPNVHVLEKNGKKEFIILPYEDYLTIQEELACYEDLRLLRETKEQENDMPSVSLAEAKKMLNIE